MNLSSGTIVQSLSTPSFGGKNPFVFLKLRRIKLRIVLLVRSENTVLFASVMEGCPEIQSESFSAEDPELILKKTSQLALLFHFLTSLFEFEGLVEVILFAADPETTRVHFQTQTQFSHVGKQFLHFL